jgi:hypothetical protein
MTAIPQLLTMTPAPGVTSRYGFISTAQTLQPFFDAGYEITSAQTKRVRRQPEERAPYVKHLLRLRPAQPITPLVGEVIPEVLLINSHDGSTKFRLLAGLFRLVCSNGLIVADATFGELTIPHTQLKSGGALDAAHTMARQASLVATRDVPAMMAKRLTPGQALDFAESFAPDLRPMDLLMVRRDSDAPSNLWTVFNRVQENLTKGGVARSARTVTGRRSSTRPIRSIDRTLAMNLSLWQHALATLHTN